MSSTLLALQGFVAVLNAEFGAGLAQDGAGPVVVETGSGRIVSLAGSPDGVDLVLSSPLLGLEGPGDVIVLGAALACNLYQEETCGGAIGLDTHSQLLVLSWRIASERIDSQDLLVAFTNFCATADRLEQTLTQVLAEFSGAERA
ncbi:MAG: Tir chaperone protein (CesT) family [Pseudomonadota bacterium]|jgi:hypothetical protein